MEINYCMHCMERLPLGQSRCSACGNDNGNIPVRHNALNPGTILRGRYLVGRVLGQGGFGITYIGMDLLLEIKVCIKEYYPSGLASRNSSVSNEIRWEQGGEDSRRTGSSSFLQEARKMAQLSNIPSVARVQDMFLENNTSYIAMEFIEGRTLKAQLQKEGLMDFNSCVSMLRPMLEDLVKIHSSGLIHRDISPDNIMVRPDGRVCLLDLGTVKDLNVQNSPASAVVAKTGFSPLEQYSSGKGVGPWTDVYAMCATIAYCVTGRCLPSALDRMEEDTMTLEGGRYPMNQGQKDALTQGLQLRAKNRLQNMQQLIDRLDGAAPAPEPVLEAIPCTEPIPQSGWKTSPVPGPISQEPEKPKEQPKEPEKPKEQPKPKVDEVPSTDIADQTKASSGGIIYTYEEKYSGWVVTGRNKRTPAEQTLESSIHGRPVVAIAERAFLDQIGLRSLVLPAGLKRIGESAFEGCIQLQTLSIPSGVKLVDDSAFARCSGLKQLTLEGVASLGRRSFAQCTALEQLTLVDTVHVWEEAFRDCTALTQVNLSQKLVTLWDQVFAGCTALEQIDIPQSVRTIRREAFAGCTALKRVDIPDGVAYIGRSAFRGCAKLRRVALNWDTELHPEEIGVSYFRS